MKVLVTGATGFIGRHLCARLIADGYRVRALVRPSTAPERVRSLAVTETVVGDITVADSLGPVVDGVDAVVHLAGVVAAARSGVYALVNTVGTRNLAQAVRGRSIRRFVHVSSLAAQGPSKPGRPHVDPGDEQPVNDYGRSKLDAERLLRSEAQGVPCTVLRPAFVYGPHDRELASWARMARLRILPVVRDFELSFVHVEDLCGAISGLLAVDDAPFGPFFVSDGASIAMSTLADILEAGVAAGPSVRVPVPAWMLRSVAPAIERATTAMRAGPLVARTLREMSGGGWSCTPAALEGVLGAGAWRPFRAGLRQTLDWYREHGWL